MWNYALCSPEENSNNCLLGKWAVSTIWLCEAVGLQVLPIQKNMIFWHVQDNLYVCHTVIITFLSDYSGGSSNCQTGGAPIFCKNFYTPQPALICSRGVQDCSPGKFWNLRPQMTHSRRYFGRNIVVDPPLDWHVVSHAATNFHYILVEIFQESYL